MATLHQLAQLDRSGLALNQRKHTNTVVVKSMIVILKNVYKTKIRTQVQLETQVTPVLPQQRLAKFVDDDLMLCHRRQSERERESERARQCLQTKQIGERHKHKQTKARIPQKHLRNPNRWKIFVRTFVASVIDRQLTAIVTCVWAVLPESGIYTIWMLKAKRTFESAHSGRLNFHPRRKKNVYIAVYELN